MALECVQVRRPEAAEGLDPGVQLLKRLRPEAIQPALRVHGRLHETGLSQHPQMLRDGRLRHAELALDLADRTMRREQEAQNGAAVWLGNDFKNRFHVFLYTSKGIFLSRYIRHVLGTFSTSPADVLRWTCGARLIFVRRAERSFAAALRTPRNSAAPRRRRWLGSEPFRYEKRLSQNPRNACLPAGIMTQAADGPQTDRILIAARG